MGYNCVVLAKQVPDTQRISGQVMNDDGTVNRSALPAIFNPEDLNALELALQIKERFGGRVTVITMGLPAAAAILREALYRGADEAILLTDRRCAASDTLATSYILSCAVKKLDYDIVLCGRQAIDGDTAQVGPQLAEKLGLTQITYVEALPEFDGRTLTVRRSIGNGWQLVRTQLPVLLTVTADANERRVAAAKKTMKYKNARTRIEVEVEVRRLATPSAVGVASLNAQDPTKQTANRAATVRERTTQESEVEVEQLVEQRCSELAAKNLLIKQWDLDDIEADLTWCGRDGSPTKVHRIQSVVLAAKESREIEPTDNGIADMIHELIEDKIIA